MNETVTFLRKVQAEIVTLAAMSVAYPSWDSNEARQRINEVWHDIGSKTRKPYNQRISIDGLRSADLEDLQLLGFAPLNDLLLIPLWVYNYIADGQPLVRVDGRTFNKRSGEQDLETKYGCIGYGFIYSTGPTVWQTTETINERTTSVPATKKLAGRSYKSKKDKEAEAKAKWEASQMITQQPPAPIALPEFLDPDLAAVIAKGDTIVVPPPGPNDFVYEDDNG